MNKMERLKNASIRSLSLAFVQHHPAGDKYTYSLAMAQLATLANKKWLP
jgi:hypothetical protein